MLCTSIMIVHADDEPIIIACMRITLHACARGKAIGFVGRRLLVSAVYCLSAQISPDLSILASEQSVSTTKIVENSEKPICVF